MHGSDIGSLVIYSSTKTQQMNEIQRIDGEQGNVWKQLDVDLNVNLNDKEYLRIIVEGVVGGSFQGMNMISRSKNMIIDIIYFLQVISLLMM